jgi:hypothetical protein
MIVPAGGEDVVVNPVNPVPSPSNDPENDPVKDPFNACVDVIDPVTCTLPRDINPFCISNRPDIYYKYFNDRI